MNYSDKKAVRLWSIISGVSLLVMAIAAGVAYGNILNQIYIEGSPQSTSLNIQNNASLYFAGSLLWCLILLTDIAVSYGFYRFLNTLRRIPALISGLLRLVYSAILAAGITQLFRGDIQSFMQIWSVGLFIFGFHLIITGFTLFYGTNLLKILGVLLIIAGAGYSLVHGIENFLPGGESLAGKVEKILMVPMTAGELLFGIWLLFRGGRRINQQSSVHRVQGAV